MALTGGIVYSERGGTKIPRTFRSAFVVCFSFPIFPFIVGKHEMTYILDLCHEAEFWRLYFERKR